MAAWQVKAGECLLIDSGPTGKHLFVLALDKTVNGKTQVLSIPVCSVKDSVHIDGSCILQAGDHPFVKHESFVEYRHSRIDDAEHLLNCVEEKTFIPHDPVSSALLKRIVDGLSTSKLVKRYIKDEFC